MATSVYFNAHDNNSWTSVQTYTVNRIQAMSRSKYQSDLDVKIANCNTTFDGYSPKELGEAESVLQWFYDTNYYSQSWLNNAISRLLTGVKNRRMKLQSRIPQQQKKSSGKKMTNTSNEVNQVKVEAPKTPASQKTAEVTTDFPTFEEPSFPDTSKDLFTEMLSKGSKMPTV